MQPKIMTFCGCNSEECFASEKVKVIALNSIQVKPDIVCDVSTWFGEVRLYEVVLGETDFVAATVPIYETIIKNNILTPSLILRDILNCINAGVKLVTIHPTPDAELVDLSLARMTAITSRGGKIVAQNALSDSFLGNYYSEIIKDIAFAARENDVCISIGSVFRGANIFDAMDAVNVAEIKKQILIASYFREMGVETIIEGPGHISLNKIPFFVELVKSSRLKVMPLGPIVCERTLECDNIVGAIGAVVLGMHLDIANIAAVSPVEHSGGIPGLHDTILAIKSAKIASSLIGSYYTNDFSDDLDVVLNRCDNQSCVSTGHCDRCSSLCPLISGADKL